MSAAVQRPRAGRGGPVWPAARAPAACRVLANPARAWAQQSPSRGINSPEGAEDAVGRRGVPVAAMDGPGSDPGGARGSAALTSACTAARRASRMAWSRPSPLALLPVAAVVVVVVAPDVVVAAGSAIQDFTVCCTS